MDLLEDLYVRQGLSVAEVASRLGLVGDSVYTILRRCGIPLRSGRGAVPVSLSRAEIVELYVAQRLSEEDIAARLGTSAWQVRLRRRALGVRRPASPPPHAPPVASPGPEVLKTLYLDEGLSLVEIARKYHTSGPKVRRWLEEAGIGVAARTSRADRIDLPVEDLRALYEVSVCP